MEMWYLGNLHRRFSARTFPGSDDPAAHGLSHYIGLEDTFSFKDEALHAFVLYAVGFVAASVALRLFAVIQ